MGSKVSRMKDEGVLWQRRLRSDVASQSTAVRTPLLRAVSDDSENRDIAQASLRAYPDRDDTRASEDCGKLDR
jgi:hypothetical protein